MDKKNMPRIIWVIILFWVLFFISCSLIAFLSLQTHWGISIVYFPLAFLSLIFAVGFFHQKVVVFRIARWFNLIVLVGMLFFLVKGGDESEIVFYISVVSIFGLMQAACSLRKVKTRFEHPKGVYIKDEKRA
jgi:hypothetical protein